MGGFAKKRSGLGSVLGSIVAAAGMLGLGIAFSGGLTACTSYTNVPSPDNALAGQDPNARQASAATLAGLRWAIRKHPVAGPYQLNLPVGTSTETAERIAASLGPGATIPRGTAMNLPTYHVPRVWIRVSDAKVDVVYPVTGADGVAFNRGVTTWLHAGVRPWTVSRGQYWAPGTVDVPPTWVPVLQAELDAMERADRAARRAFRRDAKNDADAAEQATEAAPVVEPVAEPQAAPVAEPEAQPVVEPVTEPTADPAAQPSVDPASGSTWREVPVGGGG